MKRLFPVFLAFLAVAAFSSCEKRDYTCACKVSDGTTTEKWIGLMPNDQAQKICNDFQLEQAKNATGLVYICKTTY